MKKLFITAATLLALAACSSPNTTSQATGGRNSTPTTDARQLCVSNDCASKTVLAMVGGAEYLLFTDSGRLFVASDVNVYEVTRSGEDWLTTPIGTMDCGYAGLEQVGNVLYANGCNQLFATELKDSPALQAIHRYDGFDLANGLSADPSGNLYAVNGPIGSSGLVDAQIAKLMINPNNPFEVLEQIRWADDGLELPNGIDYFDGKFYVSDSSISQVQFGAIRTIDLLDDGSAGEVNTLTTWFGILDDISVVDGQYILVADYLTGVIGQVSLDGDILQTTLPLTFQNPSAVLAGEPPLFNKNDILVTEKGLLLEHNSPIGNKLSLFRPNDSAAN